MTAPDPYLLPMRMDPLDPQRLTLKDGREFRVRPSAYRGYVRLHGDELLVTDIRRVVTEGGGLGRSGAEALEILKRAGMGEPSWPAPGDKLDDLEQAVIELRRVIDELRDDLPTAPGEKQGRPYVSERAWGLRHASLCGWAARLAIVGNPRHAGSPLLGEAIDLREELLARADEIQPRTGYRKR